MKVKSRMACPVRQKDGSWKVVIEEFEEDIPDLGRHTVICNKCKENSYPKCREWCPIDKDYEKRKLKKQTK